MKYIITGTLLLSSLFAFSQTENTDATRTETAKESDYVEAQSSTEQKKEAVPFIKKLYFGGTFGANFGSDYTSITVAPTIGYAIKPTLFTGLKFYYTYSKQTIRLLSKSEQYEFHNYGVGTFLRWFALKNIFLHVAPEMMNYQYNTVYTNGSVVETREWVPFFWAGAGYRSMISKRSWFSVHVLFDLIQDNGSPYDQWEPNLVIGAGTSF